MVDSSIQALQQSSPPAPGDTSILFSGLASPRKSMFEILEAQNKFTREFEASRGQAAPSELIGLLENLKELQQRFGDIETAVRNDLFPHRMREIEQLIAGLGTPCTPNLGKDFLTCMADAGCKTEIDPTLTNPAQYTSYSYSRKNRGFVNKISLNSQKISDLYVMTNSIIHEMTHGFQKHAAPALHFSPFNPDTRVLIHPEDWILLENLCERDAYAKQALFNALISEDEPSVRDTSRVDVVSVEDFDNARLDFSTLQQTITHLALNALYKPTVKGDSSRNFEHNYIDIALKNYIAGMKSRRQERETDHVFVRLSPHDLWAIGSYNVGPNSLGFRNLDEGFLQRPHLLCDQQETLRGILAEFDIPSLHTCDYLSNHHITLRQQTAASPAQFSL